MTSVQRAYSQRNTNLTQIVPKLIGNSGHIPSPIADISGVSLYLLDLPNVQNAGGVYYVDLNGVDASGNPIDVSGLFDTDKANIVNFGVNVPFPASYSPGLEFTIFFKNPPLDRVTQGIGPIPLLTLGLVALDGAPIPYIVSPPIPWLSGPNIAQSLTFKSDGTAYNVTSSGPAGWYGVPVLSILLNIGI
jgi:hypothetical protein